MPAQLFVGQRTFEQSDYFWEAGVEIHFLRFRHRLGLACQEKVEDRVVIEFREGGFADGHKSYLAVQGRHALYPIRLDQRSRRPMYGAALVLLERVDTVSYIDFIAPPARSPP
jgi:hypothetical protein